MADDTADTSLLELATELTMAWLSNPNTRASAEEVPAFLQSMHGAVTGLASGPASAEEVAPAAEYIPAVSPRRSLASKDHIISLIDGKPYKTLKRHLSGHGLTPAEYRERYGLKADYPMVAETYTEMRRGLAKKIGLGRKAGTKVVAKATTPTKPAATKPAAAKPTATAPAAEKPEAKPAAAKAASSPAVVKSAKPAKANKPKTQRRARTPSTEAAPQS
ncbi:MucR family transcriptional regulator [Novosphingobium sp. G106]|uniref:MucR family transcriptional regulator n=1 Tax=Novosphingobium sp. G106 TaxID=2849500 RepID=UPI001C2DBCF7|nr:MucR family transcriptional regulator [Novosphingobium sp. G106]